MEKYQSKNKYVCKVSIICIFIMMLQFMNPATTIAEGDYINVAKPQLVSKTASIKSQIETIDQATLEKIKEDEINKELENAILNQNQEESFVMPTADYLSSDIKKIWGAKVAGTDKWNDLILKVSLEEGIDPVFVKCIMAIESSGNINAHNKKNANGTQDYGLMQVNTSWGSYFDYNRMLDDPEYAIRSGIQVIKCKITSAERSGDEPTAYEVFWRYNGKSAKGKEYADNIAKLYVQLSGKSVNEYVTIDVEEKNA